MRKTCIITAAALLALSSLVCAQDSPAANPAPALPDEIVGPPLVAWSAVQQPRPIPATSPSAESGTSDVRGDQPQTVQSDSERPQSSIETFTGTLTKDGGRYLLKVSNAAYQLDEQEQLKSCEGKQVRIAGKLDAKNNVLHIANIEVLL